jgi:hypothetical protein
MVYKPTYNWGAPPCGFTVYGFMALGLPDY